MRLRVGAYWCHTNARLSSGIGARRFMWRTWYSFVHKNDVFLWWHRPMYLLSANFLNFNLCRVPFRSWSQGQVCMGLVSCDCSKKLVQTFVFAHGFFSCLNKLFFLFAERVQCEAANCRVQAKCGVCKVILLYLDSTVWLLWFNFILSLPSHRHDHSFGVRGHTGLFCYR